MTTQEAQDRLAEISARLTAWRDRDASSSGDTFQASEFDINAPDSYWLLEQLSDYRHAALSSDAALEQADLQIGALRAEQARLRAQLDVVRSKVTTTLVDEEYQALLRWRRVFLECEDVEPEKLRAPQNQLVCYAIADAMTLRDIDQFLSAETPAEDDGKSARDNRPAFSQVDLDTATKPLHAEIERLRAECDEAQKNANSYLRHMYFGLRAENERLKAKAEKWDRLTAPRFFTRL